MTFLVFLLVLYFPGLRWRNQVLECFKWLHFLDFLCRSRGFVASLFSLDVLPISENSSLSIEVFSLTSIASLVSAIVMSQNFMISFIVSNEKSFSFENQLLMNSWSKLRRVGSSSSFKPFGIEQSLIRVKENICGTHSWLIFLSNDLVLNLERETEK